MSLRHKYRYPKTRSPLFFLLLTRSTYPIALTLPSDRLSINVQKTSLICHFLMKGSLTIDRVRWILNLIQADAQRLIEEMVNEGLLESYETNFNHQRVVHYQLVKIDQPQPTQPASSDRSRLGELKITIDPSLKGSWKPSSKVSARDRDAQIQEERRVAAQIEADRLKRLQSNSKASKSKSNSKTSKPVGSGEKRSLPTTQDCLTRLDLALDALVKEGKPFSISRWAMRAGTCTQVVYKPAYRHLKERMERENKRLQDQVQAKARAEKQKALETSKSVSPEKNLNAAQSTRAVFEAIESSPGISQVELSRSLGLSLLEVHLRTAQLWREGLIRADGKAIGSDGARYQIVDTVDLQNFDEVG